MAITETQEGNTLHASASVISVPSHWPAHVAEPSIRGQMSTFAPLGEGGGTGNSKEL